MSIAPAAVVKRSSAIIRVCWPGVYAAFCYVIAVNVASGPGVIAVLVGLSVSIVVGPLLRDVFMDAPSGVSGPMHLQDLSKEVAGYLHVQPRPVIVSANEHGLAAVRGVLPSHQRIEVSVPVLDVPVNTTRAILAHEYAHVASHHQLYSAVAAFLSWATPALIAGLGIAWLPTTLSRVTIGLLYAAATVASVLAWCHAMREQELRADALASTCPGVREELVAHLNDMAALGWDSSDHMTSLLSLHPSCTQRVERLNVGVDHADPAR